MPPSPRYGTVERLRALLDRDYADQVDEDQDNEEAAAESDTAAALPDPVLVERLQSAANQVDSALAPYYAAVPFPSDNVPGVVVDLTEAIAAYLATLTHVQSQDLEKDDPVRLRYEWAMRQLDAIARGTAGVPGHVRVVEAAAGSGTVLAPRNPYPGRMFTPDSFGLTGGGGPDRGGWDVR